MVQIEGKGKQSWQMVRKKDGVHHYWDEVR